MIDDIDHSFKSPPRSSCIKIYLPKLFSRSNECCFKTLFTHAVYNACKITTVKQTQPCDASKDDSICRPKFVSLCIKYVHEPNSL